ncbi:MAG: DNA polymerase IV [Acidobacteriales bacterium]|nr:DNA polymerase IV [Terriglobales bacterium]
MSLPSGKTYFHVDMDAFFVSVEELFDPGLKGKAVVVGGQRDERGVVSAASYEARKFGVHSAMPLRTAAKLCPQAIFVNGHPDRYRECSKRIYEVLCRFSPLVEMASIDEAYLDMTGTERLYGPPLRAAHELHQTMKRETQMNCSIGIAGSRVVAKITSDQAKPNGVLWVVPGTEAAFLAPLDIRKMPGVGKVTEKKLHDLGIRTIGELAQQQDKYLHEQLGEWGLSLAAKARGEDAGGWYDTEIGEEDGPRSISHEHTFNQDIAEQGELEGMLLRLCEMVGRRLREHGLHARTLHLKLRYSDFRTITRAHSLPQPTQLDNEIYREVRALFRANWRSGHAVRLLGVGTANFDEPGGQIGLLDASTPHRWEKALNAADRLRDKFGDGSVRLGSGMRRVIREKTHEALPDAQGKKPFTTKDTKEHKGES